MNANVGEHLAEPVKAQSLKTLLSNAALDPDKTLVSQIHELLRNLIVGMQIHPGQALSEKEIAELLKASKTPVREAMIRLEDEGLVEIVPKSGTYVAPLKMERYMAACFIRLNLEIGAVRAAALNPDRCAFANTFRDLLAEQKGAVSADEQLFFQLDETLHRLFFEVAGVPGVWTTVQRSQADVHRVRHLRRMRNIKNGPKVIRDHEEITDAILEGNPDRAQAALIGHIGSLEAKFNALTAQPELMAFIETLNSRRARSRRARSGLLAGGKGAEERCQA